MFSHCKDRAFIWGVQEIFRLFRLDIATGGKYRDKLDEPLPDLSRHTAEIKGGWLAGPDVGYHELENLRIVILCAKVIISAMAGRRRGLWRWADYFHLHKVDDFVGPFDNKVYLCALALIVLGRNETPGRRFGCHAWDSESELYVRKMSQTDFLESESLPRFDT